MPATNESPRQFATMGFSFCAKARNPEWGSSDFTNSWFWNYSSRHETKLKNQRDLVWRKKNCWWPGNQVSTHFAFVPLDEDAWIKRGLGNIKKLTSRAKRCRQCVYHTKTKQNKTYTWSVSSGPQPKVPLAITDSLTRTVIDSALSSVCY